MAGKCPKCEKRLTHVNFSAMESRQGFGGNTLLAIAHTCPYCSTILSVQVDPIAVKTDTIDGLAKLLGRH